MTDPGGTESGPALAGAQVLGQAEAAVLVTSADGGLRYANPFARRLFDLAEGAPPVPAGLARQVLRGQSWDGTFAARRPDRTTVFVRAQAVPLRAASGTVDGIVIIAREATRRGSQRERDRIRLLEQIGERLAGSLELDVTLRHVAETLVPLFADHCLIDLFQGDKLIRRAQIHARDWRPPPGSWAPVGDQIRYPAGHFCQQAMARLEPVLVEELAEGDFPAPTEASLRAAENVGLTSIVAAPLLARGQLLGVMSLALSRLTRRQDPRYDADDRDFLAAVASRVAIAIDNAMLFEEERRTALAFQTSLLPQHLPSFDGISVAWRYVPARPLETHGQGIQTQVGGDWYDLIPLSAGRVGIVIGDVEGRGAGAAAVMGQLRTALRAFAQDDKPPAEILHKLDDWCRTLGAGPHPPVVSCTYLVYDAWSRTLSFANAGHDAPLLVSGGAVAKLPMADKGLLLGVRAMAVAGAPAYREETRRLPPGSTLVLYTDGLTDRRQRPGGHGHYSEDEAFAMLTEAVRRAAGAGVQAIAQAAEEAVPGDVDDDMAIVVVQTSAERLDSWERKFPAEAVRVPEARRLAGSVFSKWGMQPGEIELTCLLVSEVVTNVVLHTAAARRRQQFALESAPVPSLVPRPSLTLDGAGGAAAVLARGDDPPRPPRRGMAGSAGPPGPAREDMARGDDRPGPLPSGREFTLRLRRGGAAVWVEVFDSDLRLPRIRTAADTDEGGRGLYLVDRLASRWGSRPTRDGKVVWFEVPTGAPTARELP